MIKTQDHDRDQSHKELVSQLAQWVKFNGGLITWSLCVPERNGIQEGPV